MDVINEWEKSYFPLEVIVGVDVAFLSWKHCSLWLHKSAYSKGALHMPPRQEQDIMRRFAWYVGVWEDSNTRAGGCKPLIRHHRR